MVAVYTPIGGGRIGKAEAFDVLAHALNIEERPIGEVRRDVFRLVFDLGRYAFAAGGQAKLHELTPWPESWDLLGCLYEGLATLESEAMTPIHAANLQQFLDERAADVEADEQSQSSAG